MEAKAFDDGRHIIGLHCGEESESSKAEDDAFYERESIMLGATIEEVSDEDLDSEQRENSNFDDDFHLTSNSLRDITLDE